MHVLGTRRPRREGGPILKDEVGSKPWELVTIVAAGWTPGTAYDRLPCGPKDQVARTVRTDFSVITGEAW